MPSTVIVAVSPGDREVMESPLRAASMLVGLAQQARIVFLATGGGLWSMMPWPVLATRSCGPSGWGNPMVLAAAGR